MVTIGIITELLVYPGVIFLGISPKKLKSLFVTSEKYIPDLNGENTM